MKLLKSRSFQIILGIIILAAIGIGGYFYIAGSNNTQNTQDQLPSSNDNVQTLSPSSIGLKLEASSDDKKVRFTITDASDIKSIEYELTYNANSTAEEQSEGAQARVQRGITGQENVSLGSSSYTSSWLILGSQSANMVRYDTGVTGVNITLKITKTDNKIYQVQDSLNF